MLITLVFYSQILVNYLTSYDFSQFRYYLSHFRVSKIQAKIFTQKSMARLPIDRYSFSEQFDILFAKFEAIFKQLSIILFNFNLNKNCFYCLGRPTGRPRPVSRPDRCLRRPSHRPAQTGARPGLCQRMSASWPAQAGVQAGCVGRAAAPDGESADDDPVPAVRRGVSGVSTRAVRRRSSARARRPCGDACVVECTATADGRRHPARRRGCRGGGGIGSCPGDARAH